MTVRSVDGFLVGCGDEVPDSRGGGGSEEAPNVIETGIASTQSGICRSAVVAVVGPNAQSRAQGVHESV